MSKRAVLSRLLLVSGVGIGLSTATWLALQRGRVPERWGIPAALFVAAFLVSWAGGRLSAGERSAAAESRSARPLNRGWPAARLLAGAVSLGAFVWTWVLQTRPDPSPVALLPWIAAMVAVVCAFPGVTGDRPERVLPGRRGMILAVAAVVLLAAAARLIRLDLVQPVFSGDEASVAMDGKKVLQHRADSDPFGTGVNSSMHVGMIPAGAGALLFDSKVGGPRVFCGIIGTLAVAVTAGAAALLAGPWAGLGAAALIAFTPNHVHFSRSSNNVVDDSLTVTAALLCLFVVLKTGSPRLACLAGVLSGVAIYGYGGGRIMPVVLLASLPLVLWRFRGLWKRQAALAAAIIAGFLIAAGPNLHFAMLHFPEWNGRYNKTSIFAPEWNRQEVKLQGSETKVILNQIRLGTIGVLSSGPTIDIFTGVPMIAPPLLPALGIAGLGWLYGRRRFFSEASLAALVIGGNLAGVSLTLSTPQPQRASSLVPMLALLGGIALAGFLTLFPERFRGVPLRAALGALLVGVSLARQMSGFPLDWLPYAESGGRHAAMAQSVCGFLSAPRYAHVPIYFHGAPFVFWDFPSFRYFLPGREVTLMADEDPYSVPPGLHVFAEEYLEKAKSWARSMEILHAVSLPHPAFAKQDVAFVVLLTTESPPPELVAP